MKIKIQNVSTDILISTISNSVSKAEVCLKLNLNYNGTSTRFLCRLMKENNLQFKRHSKYTYIKKTCPVCKKEFETIINQRDEKTVCSRSCSNTYFRSGSNNGRYKTGSSNYRNICLLNYEKKCLLCGEDRIIEVHHLDRDRFNNSKENLVPLCPTHHRLLHTKKYNSIIKEQIGLKL